MLLEKQQEKRKSPLLAEYFVPLECGPCLVSNGKGGAVWVEQASKRSSVRVAPGEPFVTNEWLLRQALSRFGEGLEAQWVEVAEFEDPVASLRDLGWDSPHLIHRPGRPLGLYPGLHTSEAEFVPKGFAVLVERNRGLVGGHQMYSDGLTSFYFHPQRSMRVLHV